MVGANNELAIARLINKAVKYNIGDFTPIGWWRPSPWCWSHRTRPA
jgi:hypothetical protein